MLDKIGSPKGKRGKMKMQDTNNSPKETSKKTDDSATESEALFSKEQVKSILRSFITAYLNNDIKIRFPLADEVREQAKYRNEKLDKEASQAQEAKYKMDLNDLISVASGHTGATPQQQEVAIFELWQKVLDLRSGNRIDGKFLVYSLEDRIKRIEERLKDLFDHYEQLYFYVRTHVSDDNVPNMPP
jgi:hypothetical protein